MQNVDNKREREKVMVSVHCYQPQMREQIRQVMRYSAKDAVPSPGHGNQTLNRKS